MEAKDVAIVPRPGLLLLLLHGVAKEVFGV
jgi:hypothetical protein